MNKLFVGYAVYGLLCMCDKCAGYIRHIYFIRHYICLYILCVAVSILDMISHMFRIRVLIAGMQQAVCSNSIFSLKFHINLHGSVFIEQSFICMDIIVYKVMIA